MVWAEEKRDVDSVDNAYGEKRVVWAEEKKRDVDSVDNAYGEKRVVWAEEK